MPEPVKIVWTHAALVERACRWLLNSAGCKYVCQEPKPHGCDEHVDMIGWLPSGESLVVECKASLADFRADRYKDWRRTSTGMGFWKYYLVPHDLLVSSHSRAGEGLLEARGRVVQVIKKAEPRQNRDMAAEIRLLLASCTVSPNKMMTGGPLLDSSPADLPLLDPKTPQEGTLP